MAAETAMMFALASGRTLVLPPKLSFYLLDKVNHDLPSLPSSLLSYSLTQNDHGFNRYLFDSFFDLEKVHPPPLSLSAFQVMWFLDF
jgi:hypothetical protein